MKGVFSVKRFFAIFASLIISISVVGCSKENITTSEITSSGDVSDTILNSQDSSLPDVSKEETSNSSAEEETSSTSIVDDTSSASIEETSSAYAEDETSSAPVEETNEMTTMEFVRSMGVGINLGNTFDCTGTWFSQTVEGQETAWGSPVITKEMIAGYAKAGFGVIRLPVSWLTLADSDGNIPDEFMDRIEEVAGWILDNNMRCIINTHHDGWETKFADDYDSAIKLYEHIWEQVAERFKDYGYDLMLESMNEVGFDGIWNQYGGTEGKQEAFDIFNKINQKFVDIVRSSGGNNQNRHLLIAAYWTSSDHACDDMFILPDDPAERLAVSVHYYTPSTLCILTEDADWGKARTDWGSEADYKELNAAFDKLKEHYTDKGIPVIVGEYGCFGDNKTRETRELWMSDVANAAYERHMCPILWDTSGDEYDRESATFRYPDFISKLVGIAGDN